MMYGLTIEIAGQRGALCIHEGEKSKMLVTNDGSDLLAAAIMTVIPSTDPATQAIAGYAFLLRTKAEVIKCEGAFIEGRVQVDVRGWDVGNVFNHVYTMHHPQLLEYQGVPFDEYIGGE